MEVGLDVEIRAARPTDAFGVGALHIQYERELGHACGPGFLDDLVDAWLASGERVTFLAVDGTGRPVGVVDGAVVRALPRPGRSREACVDLSLLYVSAGCRRAGLGTALVQQLRAWARGQGVSRVRLDAEEAAWPQSRRLGFEVAAADQLELSL